MAKILTVDDDRELNRLYRNILEGGSHHVIAQAHDGEEAVRIYRSLCAYPDLIIMDHRMPGMDGIETMEEIRSIKPWQGFIFVTADPDAGKRAIESGAWGFILKPFRMDDLFNSIETAISEIERRRYEIRERVLAMVVKIGSNLETAISACHNIDEALLKDFVPDEEIELDELGEAICDFFNFLGLDYSHEVSGRSLLIRNKKCHWMEIAGRNPMLCFTTKSIISRMMAKTGRNLTLRTISAIMDNDEECVFEIVEC